MSTPTLQIEVSYDAKKKKVTVDKNPAVVNHSPETIEFVPAPTEGTPAWTFNAFTPDSRFADQFSTPTVTAGSITATDYNTDSARGPVRIPYTLSLNVPGPTGEMEVISVDPEIKNTEPDPEP